MENLKFKLNTENVLKAEFSTASSLINNLEVYGFIAIDSTEIEFINFQTTINDIVDTGNSNNIVCGDRLMQTLYLPDSKGKVKFTNQVVPIYKEICYAKEEKDYNLSSIYVPAFTSIELYKKMRKKILKIGVNDYNLRRYNFPLNVIDKNGVTTYISKENDILFKDKDGVVKGISDKAMAICRYINPITGNISFGIFELEDLK